ncbi:MAG: HDOD domain-containing protein [Acidobacteriota bacterium]|nr:HDOD domain-containing protein [Acidobacteriota bacterium]
MGDRFDLPPLPAGDLPAAAPNLVPRSLKIVNSAYYDLARPIGELRHAAAYLGADEMQRIGLTVAVMDRLTPDDPDAFRDFWYHAFHTALAARQIARRHMTTCDLEELHIAASLHDIGKLVYMKFFPDAYRQLQVHAGQKGLSLCEAEASLTMPSHADMGTALCRRWKLPGSVLRACLKHELEDLSGGHLDDQQQLICLANLLSGLSTTEMTDVRKNEIREVALTTMGCSEAEFLLLMGELYEMHLKVQQLTDEL